CTALRERAAVVANDARPDAGARSSRAEARADPREKPRRPRREATAALRRPRRRSRPCDAAPLARALGRATPVPARGEFLPPLRSPARGPEGLPPHPASNRSLPL